MHSARARAVGEQFGRRVAVLAAERAEAVLALHAGHPSEARATLERARQLAEELGQPYELARTLQLLAEAHEAAGNHFAAAPLRDRAQTLLDGLGAAPIARWVRKGPAATRRPAAAS
jgi:hypothetical protein